MIDSDGFIVSPKEIEKDMTSHPDVADVSVLGVKHEKLEPPAENPFLKPGCARIKI
ncbi:hypothetical protein ES705_12006 [subsurface metagenome]